MIPVRVFTHPTCATCPNAIRLAQKLAEENPNVELRIVSLGSASGREIAKTEQILSVPTVLVGDTRFVGVPKWDELVAAVGRK
ncbi:MAG: thioredoxin [Gammaproteobacteria bacterium]|nr:thioredoxin [Gammaproteobacteria bacterium]